MIYHAIIQRTSEGEFVDIQDSELLKEYIRLGEVLPSVDDLLDYRIDIAKKVANEHCRKIEIAAADYLLQKHHYNSLDIRPDDKYS